MADDLTPQLDEMALTGALDRVDVRMRDMQRSADAFGRSMSNAFSQGILGSRSFEDVLGDADIDALSIASPAALHFSQAKAALVERS